MKYILNSAVITAEGTFEYRHVPVQEAQIWINQGQYVSTIGYRETAIAMSEVLNCAPLAVNRVIVKMQTGDEALVFRVNLPLGERRLAVHKKGRESVQRIIENCEIGILKRIR